MSANTNQEREALKKRLRNKEHRDAFVSASVDQTIPFQIRALRLAKERNWTQEDLATQAGMKQAAISRCENQTEGQFNIRTLKTLAAAFNVGLIVRFAPFSELVEWEVNMSPESLEVPSFDREEYFKEKPADKLGEGLLKDFYSYDAAKQSTKRSEVVTKLTEYRQKRNYGIEKESSILIQNSMSEGGNEAVVG